MQVARNYFLTPEKTYTRKVKEVLLAFKLENQLSKDKILELYLNKIFLGHRAYGFAAAAEVYYDKPLQELDLAQTAMLAGLPKAPSRDNPLSNPERSLVRRNYVLDRMLKLGYITSEQHREASTRPITASRHAVLPDLQAPYVAEMVRDFMYERYGEETYSAGFRVYTTINGRFQKTADTALFNGLVIYDERHGYRGAIGRAQVSTPIEKDSLSAQLEGQPTVGELVPAIILTTAADHFTAYTRTGEFVEVDRDNYTWAHRYLDADSRGPAPKQAADVVTTGDVVYLRQLEDGHWRLSQLPAVEGALVSLRPEDGAILALSGGFNFFASKFNRATQARRQPGSNIKPFIYSAALEHGFTPASLVSGAPVVIRDDSLSAAWRPENYSKKIFGMTRLREALMRSLNLVSIRLMRSVGIDASREHLQRFGFAVEHLPRNLSLALGNASLLPIEVARAYGVFANGGFLVEPYLVQRIENLDGETIYEARPLKACRLCPAPDDSRVRPESATEDTVITAVDTAEPEPSGLPTEESADTGEAPTTPAHAPWAISRENAFLTTSMMQDVIRGGTGRRALVLGRSDLAGKTGTTNEQQDAWFSGFGPGVTTTVWVGFDQPAPMGRGEVGGRAALPIWIDYMRVALDGVPEKLLEIPAGIVPAYVSKATGQAVAEGAPDSYLEYFLAGSEPVYDPYAPTATQPGPDAAPAPTGTLPEDIL